MIKLRGTGFKGVFHRNTFSMGRMWHEKGFWVHMILKKRISFCFFFFVPSLALHMQAWVYILLSFPECLSCSTLLNVFCALCHHYPCHSGETREKRSLLMCSPVALVRRVTPWRWLQWRILWWSRSHMCTAHTENHVVLSCVMIQAGYWSSNKSFCKFTWGISTKECLILLPSTLCLHNLLFCY